jgi:hypothetical protein
LFKDPNTDEVLTVIGEPDVDIKWGPVKTFGDDKPGHYAEFYEDLPHYWYMPLSWVNYSD